MGFLSRTARLHRAISKVNPAKRVCELLESRLLLAAQPYSWSDAAIGAGGFLDGVFFDPHNSGVMYARTDIGGLYKSTNGGNNWKPLLDFVGNNAASSGNSTQGGDMQVLSFALDPENSNNLYALVGSAVLFSTNAGATWGIDNLPFSVNGNGAGRATGERIAVDPNDSNIVLVGSNVANGLFESTNAGHSFTQVASFPTTNPITFIQFNPYGGTPGSPTQNIFVGQQNNTTGSNIYQTTNGGTSWTQIANTAGPASLYPMRASFDSTNDGNIYFTYSNQIPPEGTIGNNGGVWRYNLNSATWANITPTIVGSQTTSEFVGLGVDAENPGTIVVTTFDHYNGGDFIFRTTNANAATPTWTSLFGGNNTRNTSQAQYVAAFGDGIGNWAATTAIDPFNPAHIVYGTGQGLWTTLIGNSSTTLTAANSWQFLDNGIDFTAVINLSSGAPSGAPLFSAVGDINGFAHSTLTSSPASGAILPGGSIGNMTSVDFAGTNPNLDAVVGTTGSRDGGFSTNDGLTWTEFAAKPAGSGGTVAVTSSGGTSMTIVWAPTNRAPSWSTNNGTTWTAATGGMPTGGQVFADRITPGD
ncbi:MAG TPA: hypothetical protein VKK61_12360, partial [Tepidisphaeraceae bacterium]|nr:hypothetical protein [Tepidisphaeraceae bacterium]